jgi:putative transposase
MPTAAILELQQKRKHLERQPARPRETSAARCIWENKLIFAAADRYLDHAVLGPMHLKDPRAAKIVEDAILVGAGERYDLFAWCVMSNHVHVLLMPKYQEVEEPESPLRRAGKPDLLSGQAEKTELSGCRAGKPDLLGWDLPSALKGIKGYTARQINKLQGARGSVFWQDESYDHWARDEAEMLRIIQYIEDNPVKAGLCPQADDWSWSSARCRRDWRLGEAFAVKDARQPT